MKTDVRGIIVSVHRQRPTSIFTLASGRAQTDVPSAIKYDRAHFSIRSHCPFFRQRSGPQATETAVDTWREHILQAGGRTSLYNVSWLTVSSMAALSRSN